MLHMVCCDHTVEREERSAGERRREKKEKTAHSLFCASTLITRPHCTQAVIGEVRFDGTAMRWRSGDSRSRLGRRRRSFAKGFES